MIHHKRLLALLLCAGMLTLLAVSSAFIVLEAGHSCSGGMCKICESIAKTEAVLRGLVFFAFLSLIAAALRVSEAFSAFTAARQAFFGTLVCWKVRLND